MASFFSVSPGFTFPSDTAQDIYQGTAANFNNDTFVNLKIGDQLEFTDRTTANLNFQITGPNTISYNGGTITVDNLGPGRFVIRALQGGGVDVRLQENAHNDFTGDGHSDILWRDSTTGQITDWVATASGGFTQNSSNFSTGVATNWVVAGTGDFNGDGREDILWRDTSSGQITDWLGNSTGTGGFTQNSSNFSTGVATNWAVVGTADFNGDGRTDILWRDTTTGQITDWLGTANGSFTQNSSNFSTGVATNWTVVGTGDFNGDGHNDILWRDSTSGQITDWLGTANGGFTQNSSNFSTGVATNWVVIGTGDFTGDGTTDILWRDSVTGQVTDWLGTSTGGFTQNSSNFSTQVAADWHIVSTGDFNGDGIDDILWRNDSGQMTEWVGTANGSFVDNSVNASTFVATNWHVQDAFIHG